MHQPHAVTVAGDSVGGHAHPGILHAQRLEDTFTEIAPDVPAIETADEFAENEPTGSQLIPRLRTGGPVRLRWCGANARDGFVPANAFRKPVRVPKTSGVRQQMAKCYGAFAALRKLGQVATDRIIERSQTTLDHLRNGDGSDGFAGGKPERQCGGPHRHPWSGVADGKVGNDFAAQRDVELGARMQDGLPPMFQNGKGSWQQ